MPLWELWRGDGLLPLTFEGEQILYRPVSDRDGWRDQWHEVQVYRTTEGRWILHAAYYTLWEGEVNSHQVRVADDLEGLRQAIEDLVPEHLRNEVYKNLAQTRTRLSGTTRWWFERWWWLEFTKRR